MLACVMSAFSKSEPSSVALKKIVDEVRDSRTNKVGITTFRGL